MATVFEMKFYIFNAFGYSHPNSKRECACIVTPAELWEIRAKMITNENVVRLNKEQNKIYLSKLNYIEFTVSKIPVAVAESSALPRGSKSLKTFLEN